MGQGTYMVPSAHILNCVPVWAVETCGFHPVNQRRSRKHSVCLTCSLATWVPPRGLSCPPFFSLCAQQTSDTTPVNIQGMDIEQVDTYKYLGVSWAAPCTQWWRWVTGESRLNCHAGQWAPPLAGWPDSTVEQLQWQTHSLSLCERMIQKVFPYCCC